MASSSMHCRAQRSCWCCCHHGMTAFNSWFSRRVVKCRLPGGKSWRESTQASAASKEGSCEPLACKSLSRSVRVSEPRTSSWWKKQINQFQLLLEERFPFTSNFVFWPSYLTGSMSHQRRTTSQSDTFASEIPRLLRISNKLIVRTYSTSRQQVAARSFLVLRTSPPPAGALTRQICGRGNWRFICWSQNSLGDLVDKVPSWLWLERGDAELFRTSGAAVSQGRLF